MTEKIVYRMCFLGRYFVSGLLWTLKSKKTFKNLPLKTFKSLKTSSIKFCFFFQPWCVCQCQGVVSAWRLTWAVVDDATSPRLSWVRPHPASVPAHPRLTCVPRPSHPGPHPYPAAHHWTPPAQHACRPADSVQRRTPVPRSRQGCLSVA